MLKQLVTALASGSTHVVDLLVLSTSSGEAFEVLADLFFKGIVCCTFIFNP